MTLKASIKSRIETLSAEAKAIAGRWKPDIVFIGGQPGAYTVQVNEWDGVPGSAQDGIHTKEYQFQDKSAAKAFIDSLSTEYQKKCGSPFTDLHVFDVSTQTDDERREHIDQQRPLALEVEAEREGLTLTQKLRQVYGDGANLDSLPLWGDIIRWDGERDAKKA